MKCETFLHPPTQMGGYGVLEVPPEFAEKMLGGSNKLRIVISFENGKKLHRALQRNKNGFCFISIGKSTLRELKIEEGKWHIVEIEKDLSEFGMPMPEEFEAALKQENEMEHFKNILPGRQRNLLYYIGSAKTVETRIKRSLKMIERLKSGEFG